MSSCHQDGLPAWYASYCPCCSDTYKLAHQGVIKTYRLTYESVEVVHALFDRNVAKNRWKIGAHVLRNWIEYFGAGTEQLDISLEDGRVTFMSYTEKIMGEKGPLQ